MVSFKGTCVNVGCVPKKVMYNTATLAESIHDAKEYGFDIDAAATKFDWSVIKTSRDAYIKRLNVRIPQADAGRRKRATFSNSLFFNPLFCIFPASHASLTAFIPHFDHL